MDFTQRPHTRQPLPKNWLVESILAAIFCCQPLGIVGIVFAVQVNRLYNNGDIEGAYQASDNAAKWTKLSFWIGAAIIIIVLAFLFLFGGWAFMQSQQNDY